MTQRYIACCCAAILWCANSAMAQDASHALLEQMQSLYGANDVLHQGYVHRSQARGAEGNPYLWRPDFQEGTVYIQDFAFEQTPLRYDVEVDQLIMRFQEDDFPRDVVLAAQHIDSFDLHGVRFLHKRWLDSTLNYTFATVLVGGEEQFIATFRKTFIGIYNQQTPNGKYGELYIGLFVLRGNERLDVGSRRQLFKAFPAMKAAIKQYMKEHGIRYRRASLQQYQQLFQFIATAE